MVGVINEDTVWWYHLGIMACLTKVGVSTTEAGVITTLLQSL